MGIIVHSPFSGRPVKVRDQDVGRAVRDQENRIFYVLPKADGSGYYGAVTRAGGERDEQRDAQMQAKLQHAKERSVEDVRPMHDATGRRRSGLRGRLVILVLVVLVAVLAYLFGFGPLRWSQIERGQTPQPNKVYMGQPPDSPESPKPPAPDAAPTSEPPG